MNDSQLQGVNASERIVAHLCRKSFLRLWSYANVHNDKGKEFCDILAAFGNHIFIFFVRDRKLEDLTTLEDPIVHWKRWYRETIVKQSRTARGAERYLRQGRPVFLEANNRTQLPVKYDPKTTIIHKIVVANGAGEACRKWSSQNLRGSLAITYTNDLQDFDEFPFAIHIDSKDPVHVLDDENLQIILSELDTISDFASFFDEKVVAINKVEILSYGGEEDLLANYLLNYNDRKKKHFIGPIRRNTSRLFIDQGEWIDLQTRPEYFLTKKANKISYFWDKLIDRTCVNWLAGDLLSKEDIDMRVDASAILEMTREPRFMRRALAQGMDEAIRNFPIEKQDNISRHMRFMNSFYTETSYVFLQFWVPENLRKSDEQYREKRTELLTIACGMARVTYPQLQKIVGIAIEPPKLTNRSGEDFVLLDCAAWTESDTQDFVERNIPFRFFQNSLKTERRINEFICSPERQIPKKLRRNDPCFCGSGKKYKKCCVYT